MPGNSSIRSAISGEKNHEDIKIEKVPLFEEEKNYKLEKIEE